MMSFIKAEKMRICQNRLNELREEKRIIVEKLKESPDPDSPGDFTDRESLIKYKEINKRINAVMQSIKTLQGIDDNDIIE
jgi:hypothetical protein